MEKRETAQRAVVGTELEAGRELVDIRHHVAMRQRHALGFSGTAACEEQDRFAFSPLGRDPEHLGERRSGRRFAGHEPGGDFCLHGGKDPLQEDDLPVRRPREPLGAPHEGIGGDKTINPGLLDRRADALLARREV